MRGNAPQAAPAVHVPDAVPVVHRRPRKRLLTVGHSYVLRPGRRLAEAIQQAANGEWEVTVAAPRFYQGSPRHGDLKPESLKIGSDEAIRVVGIPVAFTSHVHFALYGRQLRTLMRSGFDAVHCWEEPFMIPGAQMVRWAPRDAIVTVLTFQNIDKTYPLPFNWLERGSLARSDGWVAAATLVEDTLKDRSIYAARPHRVIGLGVDPHQFRPDAAARAKVRAGFGWTDDVPVVGFIGRLTEPKGVPLLMRVLERIERPWRALFIGSGVCETDLQAWSKRFGTDVQIASVSHGAVPDYLNAMDLLCVPSQTTAIWREQFGRVLIEAFASGVCVVASDSGEIPNVVADAGCIVGERDEEGWRAAITRLLDDVARRRELAARGLARVNMHYTWSAVGKKYVDFFNYLDEAKQKRLAMHTGTEIPA